MAFELALPDQLRKQGWKIKIRERERLEPPHLIIMRRERSWRLGLRDGQFLDDEPDPGNVPRELLELIEEHWQTLCDAWDAKYPNNPVKQKDDEDEQQDIPS